MHKHKYQWQKWSLAQEYVNQPTLGDAQSFHLSSYQYQRKALRTTREQQWQLSINRE
jgi:hypothetical protein